MVRTALWQSARLYESWLVAGHTGWLGPAAACATATKAITNRITVIVGFGEHMVVVAVDVRGTKESLRASNWNCDCTWWCCGVMQSASAPSAEKMRQKCRRLGALVQLKSKGATKAMSIPSTARIASMFSSASRVSISRQQTVLSPYSGR